MNKQPKALRLANELDGLSQPVAWDAAAELRRLHAENEKLRAGLGHPPAVDRPQCGKEQEPVALLADAIRSEPTELIHKWRVLELIQDHARQQPKRAPLTNEQVKAGLIHSIEYTDARERCAFNIGARFAERAHGIK